MPIKRWLSIALSILGLGFIIVLHEFGHFIACKIFGIQTFTFSIGFDPAIASIKIGETVFQLGAIPLGGYVSMNPEQLENAAYSVQMSIILAGVLFNFLLSFIIVSFLKYHISSPIERVWPAAQMPSERRITGIVGIIYLLSTSLATDPRLYFLNLARISTSVGLFNLLPLPILDGGKLVHFTMKHLGNTTLQAEGFGLLETLFLIALITFTLFLIFRDSKNIRN